MPKLSSQLTQSRAVAIAPPEKFVQHAPRKEDSTETLEQNFTGSPDQYCTEYPEQFYKVGWIRTEDKMRSFYNGVSKHFKKPLHPQIILKYTTYAPCPCDVHEVRKWRKPGWYLRREDSFAKKAKQGQKRPAPSVPSGSGPRKEPKRSVRPDRRQDLVSMLGNFS